MRSSVRRSDWLAPPRRCLFLRVVLRTAWIVTLPVPLHTHTSSQSPTGRVLTRKSRLRPDRAEVPRLGFGREEGALDYLLSSGCCSWVESYTCWRSVREATHAVPSTLASTHARPASSAPLTGRGAGDVRWVCRWGSAMRPEGQTGIYRLASETAKARRSTPLPAATKRHGKAFTCQCCSHRSDYQREQGD